MRGEGRRESRKLRAAAALHAASILRSPLTVFLASVSCSACCVVCVCSGGLVPEYLWRLVHWRQVDFDLALSQAADLLLHPAEVAKTTKMRKQIKNQWARDDPAFAMLLVGIILISTLAYMVAFSAWNPLHALRLLLGGVLVEFLLVGCAVCSAIRWWVNRRMRIQRLHAVEQSVEWLYAFDVHCNALFVSFLVVSCTQYCTLPLLLREGFMATLAANTLWLAGAAAYAYITFLGYSGQQTSQRDMPCCLPRCCCILSLC